MERKRGTFNYSGPGFCYKPGIHTLLFLNSRVIERSRCEIS